MAGQRRIGYTVRPMKSGRWQLVVRAEDGQQVGMGTYADKAAAERDGQAHAVKVRSGMWIDPRTSDVPLAGYLAEWLDRRQRTGKHGDRYAEDAARMLRLHIAPTLGRTLLTDLTPAAVARWYDGLVATQRNARGATGLVPAKAYRLLHAALEDAVRDQLLPRNPCMIAGAGVERCPERPLLEPGQIIDLAEAVPARWRALVLVAGWCGLR